MTVHNRADGPRTYEAGTKSEDVVDDFREEADFEAEKASLVASAESGELKGAALDEALEKAGVPRTGSADEKRTALVEALRGNVSD